MTGERNRERDRETDRQKDKGKEKKLQGETYRQTDRDRRVKGRVGWGVWGGGMGRRGAGDGGG